MYLRSPKGKQILSFVSMSTTAKSEHVLTYCILGLFCFAIIAVLSIVLQPHTANLEFMLICQL